MQVKSGFLEMVGNTPLVRLNQVSELTGLTFMARRNSSIRVGR